MGQRHGQQRKAKKRDCSDGDVAMDMWSHDELYNQKRTCEKIGKVTPVTKKITEKRLKLHGHVTRRNEGHVGLVPTKNNLSGPVPGKRRRGRQKNRQRDSYKRHMEMLG